MATANPSPGYNYTGSKVPSTFTKTGASVALATDGTNYLALQLDADGNLKTAAQVSMSINVGDVEIGAVELKNATTDDRAKVAVVTGILETDIGITVMDPVVSASLSTMGSTLTDVSASTAIFNANPSIYSSTAYESGSLVNAGDTKFISLWGYSSNASAQFIQVFDTGSFPTDGGAPFTTFKVAAESNFYFDIGGTYGIDFPLGIVVCNSTSGSIKSSGADDCWFNVAYKVV